MFVVDEALRDYQHVHPEPTEQQGVFRFDFTPHTNRNHRIWIEYTPVGYDIPERHHVDIAAEHRSAIVAYAVPPNQRTQIDGMVATWHINPETPLQQGKECIVTIHLTDLHDNPITDLQQVMGATAHMVGFTKDGNGFIHAHPIETDDPSLLQFHIKPEHAGAARFFVQVNRGGEDTYIPFSRQIKAPEQFTDRPHDALVHSHIR
jgi:hypothetical protein